jgi:TetR/AcrR family transcriptional repressor of nem operon
MTKAEQTQQRIVEEAAKLFNRKGYAATCIRDIMEATGLQKGGIYGNFENKEEIQFAAFEYALEAIARGMRAALEGVESSIAKLHAMLDFYERFVFDPPVEGGCMILNTAVEADDTNPALRDCVVKGLDRWRRRIGAIIREGIAAGEIRSDVDIKAFALLFIATVEGGVMLAKVYGDVEKIRIPLKHIHLLIDTELKER